MKRSELATPTISRLPVLEQICKRLDRRAASSGVPARVDSLDACLIFLRFGVARAGGVRMAYNEQARELRRCMAVTKAGRACRAWAVLPDPLQRSSAHS